MDPEARLSCEELKDHSYFDSYREEEMEKEKETTRTRIVGRGREQRSRVSSVPFYKLYNVFVLCVVLQSWE